MRTVESQKDSRFMRGPWASALGACALSNGVSGVTTPPPPFTMETSARTGLFPLVPSLPRTAYPQLCNLFHITEFEATHQQNCLHQNNLL